MTSLSISLKPSYTVCSNKSEGISRCEGCLQFDVALALISISGTSTLSYEGFGWSSDNDIYCPGGEIKVNVNFRDMKGQTST
ncbi:unnamed protein product [Rotaria sordida]|uniref:Uncharacterized protein n=1 Tax=Rotaria sordida TaxID=392033 RepID=A0A819HVZ7_9BILA|nr:unnamed protein product [Rotaria sordida]CAF3906255.1 unnamed protein product [Rotaria sordida]